MQSQKRWTEKCSLEALKMFPNLDVLILDGCAELWPFWPLLQRAMPLKAFRMQRSKLVQGGPKTCSRLFKCAGFRHLELDEGFVSVCPWHWLESIPPAHLSSVLTYLSVQTPTYFGCDDCNDTWVTAAVRLTTLQSLTIQGRKLHEVSRHRGSSTCCTCLSSELGTGLSNMDNHLLRLVGAPRPAPCIHQPRPAYTLPSPAEAWILGASHAPSSGMAVPPCLSSQLQKDAVIGTDPAGSAGCLLLIQLADGMSWRMIVQQGPACSALCRLSAQQHPTCTP
jgi:hypothetical protein